MPDVDTRKSVRFPLEIQELKWKRVHKKKKSDKNFFRDAGDVVDFSHSGLGVISDEPDVKEGEEFYLKYLTKEGKESVAVGRVVRIVLLSDGTKRIGLEFVKAGRHFIPGLLMEYYMTENRRLIIYMILLMAIFCILAFFLGRLSAG